MIGWSWTTLRRDYLTSPTLLRCLPVGVVIGAGVLATTWTHDLLSNHQAMVVHTYEAIDTTKDVLIALVDAETGQRGYLVSGDRRYLEPYEKALERLGQLRTDLSNMVSDNGDQKTRVQELGNLMDEKLTELKDSITLRSQAGEDVAQKKEIGYMADATMDQIRGVIGDITVHERDLVVKRQSEVNADERLVRLVAIVIGLASFMTRAAVEMYLIRRRPKRKSR